MKKFGLPMSLLALGIILCLVGTAGAVDYNYQALGQPGTEGRGVHHLAINNNGQIVGYCDMDDNSCHAFIQEGDQYVDLQDKLPEATSSQATDISDSEDVTGIFLVNGKCHGFLWENGVVSDLDAMGIFWGGFSGGRGLRGGSGLAKVLPLVGEQFGQAAVRV